MQADESISRRYGGTGLGLAISKEITEAMTGKISVESELNKGSTFSIEIPFGIKEERKKEEFHGENVIVFEERADICNVFLKMLSQYNFTTYICESEEEINSILKDSEGINTVIITRGKILEKNRKASEYILTNEEIQKRTILIKENQYINDSYYKKCSFNEYPIEQSEIIETISCILGYKYKNKLTVNHKENFIPINKRVLLIEDNEVNAKAMSEMIENFGATVKLYENGMDALRDIKANSYDLIISDIQLPDLSGFEILKLIREYDENGENRRKIIALTAHALAGYREKCITAGFDDYIAKPVTMQELYRVIAINTGESGNVDKNIEKTMEKINDKILRRLKIELVQGAVKSFGMIRQYLEIKNYDSVVFEAHKLKGSFGNASEKELYEMFTILEKMGKEKDETIYKHYERCLRFFKERFDA